MFSRTAMARTAIIFWALVATSGIFGCQSAPSPIIVGDTYTNIQYEYSLTIPRGWAPLEKIPNEMGYFKDRIKADMASLLLYNEESGGLIAVMNIVRGIAFDQFLEVSDEQWTRIVARRKEVIVRDSPGKVIKHALYPQNLYATQQNYFANQFAYKPLKYLRVESTFEVDSQRVHLNFDDFIFPCRNTMSCETIVILTCLDKNLAVNQSAYQKVLSSLKAHDYFE